jgi:hypothetical protein
MLRAVAQGRGELRGGCQALLVVDGLCCDFVATNQLVDENLVQAAWPVPVGASAPAVLTTGGVAALDELTRAA